MNMPGFYAESGLYNSTVQYHTLASLAPSTGFDQFQELVPAGFGQFQELVSFAPAAVCNPTQLAQCYQNAQQEYWNCIHDCPAGFNPCTRRCATVLSKDKRACDDQFGVCPPGTACVHGHCASQCEQALAQDPRCVLFSSGATDYYECYYCSGGLVQYCNCDSEGNLRCSPCLGPIQ